MKFTIAAVLSLLPAYALAQGTYSVTAYNEAHCPSNSSVFQTLTGTTTSSCVLFPFGRSVEVVLTGSCTAATFFGGTNCVRGSGIGPDQTDPGPFPNVGCQTFGLVAGETNQTFASYQIFC